MQMEVTGDEVKEKRRSTRGRFGIRYKDKRGTFVYICKKEEFIHCE